MSARRDLANHLLILSAVAGVTKADIDGDGGDLDGYQSGTALVHIGAGNFSAANKIEMKLQHSDNNADWEIVPETDTIGTQSVITANIAAGGENYRLGYKGDKRYLRVKLDFSGNHANNINYAVLIVGGHPLAMPTAAQ